MVVSLPERHELLAQALASVSAQTVEPDDMVVGVDRRHYGEIGNMNRLCSIVETEWVAFLHDDDLWHPNHLEVCSQFFDAADVVVSRFELVGRPWDTIEPWHDDFQDLRVTNWIGSPSMVVARRDMWEWRARNDQYRWNDWSTYNGMLDKGARFADTRTVTCDYRFMGDNGSWRP